MASADLINNFQKSRLISCSQPSDDLDVAVIHDKLDF